MHVAALLFVSALASSDTTPPRGLEPDSALVRSERSVRDRLLAQQLSAVAFQLGRDGAGDADTTKRQRRAVATSEGYATRLKIHQIGAFVMVPLVVSEFFIGESLIDKDPPRPSGLVTAHQAVAIGIGTVFGVNTVTGVLNWWETRKQPEGRTRRTLHALMMLASDAGFLWAAMAADGASRDQAGANHHRAIAEASISVSLLSTVMMWLWKG